MKKKTIHNLVEKFNTLGKVIALILAWALFVVTLSQVDAPPSDGSQSESSHEM